MQQIQIPEPVAIELAASLSAGQADLERDRAASLALQTQRKRAAQSKLDRGYEDYLDGKISEEFWTRKSAEWEAELTTVNGELSRLATRAPTYAVTGVRILELAKKAYFLYCQQNFEERRKLLEMVLSNCTFDRGTLCATYTSPFHLFAQGHETQNWRRDWDSVSVTNLFDRCQRRGHNAIQPLQLQIAVGRG